MIKLETLKADGRSVITYHTKYVYYGKTFSGTYKLELMFPAFKKHINLYKGKKKPFFRDLIVLTILWTPISVLIQIIGIILSIIILLFAEFWSVCLFKEKFITDRTERISGIIGILFYIVGIISVIALSLGYIKISI